jgi:hypothetical protein
MAASGSTTIQLYNSSTASAVPTSGNLAQGELGINVTDKKIYTKNGSGVVVMVGFGPDASVALTNLTGLTVASGGASISGNVSVAGTLTTTDNVGIGGTPAHSGVKAVDLGAGSSLINPSSSGQTWLMTNTYVSSGNKYKNSGLGASWYQQMEGAHVWYGAPSGTAGNAITFTEYGRFDASGNLLIGSTGAIFGEKLTVSNSSSSSYNIAAVSTSASYTGGGVISGSTATSGSGFRCFTGYSSSGIVFQVLGNGNVLNTNNSYGAISDIKLKQDITDATPKLAKLLKVRIVNYKFKSDPNGIKQIGVIAQELEEISPGLIEETPDYEEVTLTREVEKTVPVTVKKEVTTERVQFEVIDGAAVQTVIRETAVIAEPVVDEYPVFDGDGNPVMEVVTPATGATPAVLRQKIHTVPRMETVVDKEEYTERRLTGTTTKSVKYSIFVPMLIKAMQEQQEQIEALKAKARA